MNKKKKRFCDEYIIDLDGANAARRTGYSSKTAKQKAYELLNEEEVKQEIAKLQKSKSKRLEFDADAVLGILKKQATFDIKNIIKVKQITLKDAAGNDIVRDYIHLREWDKIDGTLISEIKQNKDLMVQVKFYDKQKALEMIGRHLGIWIDKFEHKINGSINVENTDKLKKVVDNMTPETRKLFFEMIEQNNGVD